MDGAYIATHSSALEAAKMIKETLSLKTLEKRIATNIRYCCAKKIKTAYHFFWTYTDTKKVSVTEKVSVTKTINQYNTEGEYLCTYRSITEAAEAIMKQIKKESKNVVYNSIYSCCNGKNKTAYGYRWQYADKNQKENLLPLPKCRKEKRFRKINQYSPDGKFIRTFKSIREARESVGVNNNASILRNAKKHTGLSYGYQWRYADEINGTENIDSVEENRIIHQNLSVVTENKKFKEINAKEEDV